MNNYMNRFFTSLIIFPIFFFIFWNKWSYFFLFFLISVLVLLEFYCLISLDGVFPFKIFSIFSFMFINLLFFLGEGGILSFKYFYFIFLIIFFLYFINLYKKTDLNYFTNIAYTFLGIMYIGLPFFIINLIIFFNGFYNYRFFIFFLLLIWTSDIGAYFFGIFLGRNKLFKRLSPNKTWEGSFGGFFLVFFINFLLFFYFKNLVFLECLILSLLIIITGTYGDLIESLLKRIVNIKDSGNLIPGHGGFLDRFDSFLIAIIFIVFVIKNFF